MMIRGSILVAALLLPPSHGVHLYVAANAAAGSTVCSARAPCRRITDALARTSALRAADPGVAIEIDVAAGTYPGTFGANPGGLLEDLPLVIFQPGLTVRGATRLPLDADGRPQPASDASPQTVLTSVDTEDELPDTCRSLAFISIDRARRSGDRAFTGGDGTHLEGLTIRDPLQLFSGILVGRARDVAIRQVWIDSAGDGISAEFSSVSLREVLVDGTGHNIQLGPGNAQYPARYQLAHNRSIDAGLSALNLYAADSASAIEQFIGGAQAATLEVEPVCTSGPVDGCPDVLAEGCMAPGDLLAATISDNELEGNGVGMRLWLVGVNGVPDADHGARLFATITGNSITGHVQYGIDINSGFTPRADLPWTVDVAALLAGNVFPEVARARALISFVAIQQIVHKNEFDEQPLRGSTYTILDLDHEIVGYDWANPDCDDDGRFAVGADDSFSSGSTCSAGATRLGNQAFVDGVPVPVGARISPSP